MIYAWSPVVHFECPGTRIILALAYPSQAVLPWELLQLWMTLFKLFGKDTNLLKLFSLEIGLNYCFGNVFILLRTYLYLIVNEKNFKSGNISYHPAFVAALWLNIVEKKSVQVLTTSLMGICFIGFESTFDCISGVECSITDLYI